MNPAPEEAAPGGWAAKALAARDILFQALARFAPHGLAIAWTGGKDSTLLLHLARQTAREAGCPMPQVLHIDEGDPFPEIAAFLDRLGREWGIDPVVIRNDELLAAAPAGGHVETARLSLENRRELERAGWSAPGFCLDPEAFPASHLLKTAPLRRHLERTGIAALATAIRWDEHPARQAETAFSPREDPRHVRVHPLLAFRERDVWQATFGLGLPFCELYRAGYRSLGCRSGTVKNADIPAWEQDLEGTPERAGRCQGKEEAMAQLRALGYM